MAEFGPITVTLRDGREVEIRHALPVEAPDGVEYLRDLYHHDARFLITQGPEYDADPAPYAEKLAGSLARPNALHLYAWTERRVVADTMLIGGTKARDRHTGWLGVGVRPAWQGRGLGRALVTTLLDWAAAHDHLERVTLRVFAGNARAIALYHDLGFVAEGAGRRAFKLEDGSYTDDVGMVLFVKPGVAPEGFSTYRPRALRTLLGE